MGFALSWHTCGLSTHSRRLWSTTRSALKSPG